MILAIWYHFSRFTILTNCCGYSVRCIARLMHSVCDLWCFAVVWFRSVISMSFVIATKMKVPVKWPQGMWPMKPHQFVNNDDIKKEQSARRIESDILTYALYTDWYHLPHKIPPHPIKEYIRARTHFREKGFFFKHEKSEFANSKKVSSVRHKSVRFEKG